MEHPVSGLFKQNFNTLANALAARERMQSVHATNVANADTPNFRADSRHFADFLAEKQISSGNAPLATTQTGHLSASSGQSSWQATLSQHAQAAQRMDGNNVDMQKEMAGMAENQLMHDLTLRLLKKRLDGMSNLMREVGR
ncbi:MAG: flagellar basal body rod protein FlgB [Mariprofundaceae bacterium]|nr:flagellar basal body rod protein FlgB [Mariprofundaceae bacterium]